MANPPTYPSDGRITSLQNYSAAFTGGELFPIVAPGNATAGINYNINATTLAQNLLPVLPLQNPNTVLAGPASGVATAIPTFRALVPLDIPGLVRNAVASSYAVATSDMNKLIGLGGNPGTAMPFTLSLSTASNFTTGFVCTVYNEGSGRGWAIAPNGVATFILWPQQTVQIFNDNNAWKLTPTSQRWKATSAVVFNVDNVNGSDSSANDGLSVSGGAGAFLTVFHAWATVQSSLDPSDVTPTIQLPATTSVPITETPLFSGAMPTGISEITLQGNPSNPTVCQWQFGTGQGFTATDYQSITLNGIGFSATGTSNTFASAEQYAILDFSNCDFGKNTSGLFIALQDNARANILGGCSFSGTATAVGFAQIVRNASITIASPIALNNATTLNVGNFVTALQGGVANLGGLSFTGAGTATVVGTRFVSQSGGIVTGDSGVSWPSGLATGSISGGGIDDAGMAINVNSTFVSGNLPLANIATINNSTILGNNAGTAGAPIALTQAQAQGVLEQGMTLINVINASALATAGDTTSFSAASMII
jgi:hypothetical protein